MSSTLETQQQAMERLFYAAVGAPVLIGQKAREFGKTMAGELSMANLEAAGREFANHVQESKVVEQIQESVDIEQFQEKVDLLREQLETLLMSWRDQFDTRKQPVKIEVEPAEEKVAAAKKKVTIAAKKTTAAAKPSSK